MKMRCLRSSWTLAPRPFAQDMRGNFKGQRAGEQSGWKDNKAVSFGQVTTLSIQEQRKSLPIYKLRDPLLAAIAEVRSCVSGFSRLFLTMVQHQVLIVIGDTGSGKTTQQPHPTSSPRTMRP